MAWLAFSPLSSFPVVVAVAVICCFVRIEKWNNMCNLRVGIIHSFCRTQQTAAQQTRQPATERTAEKKTFGFAVNDVAVLHRLSFFRSFVGCLGCTRYSEDQIVSERKMKIFFFS